MVARTSVSSSSSPRIASCKWRGVILFTRRSLDALPTVEMSHAKFVVELTHQQAQEPQQSGTPK